MNGSKQDAMETSPTARDAPWREFRVSPARLRHGLVLAGVIAAIGLGIALFAGPSVADAPLIGAVSLVLAAGIAAFALRAARDPAPRLVLAADGVWFRDWGLPPVPWRNVARVTSVGSRFNPFICVEVDDWEEFAATLDDATRARCRSNRLVRWPRLMVPNGAVDASFDEILAALREAQARAG